MFSIISYAQTDTIKVDSLVVSDSLLQLAEDSLKPTKKKTKRETRDDLETTVNYFAKDSAMLDAKSKIAYLYGEAWVDYGEIHLEADYIEIDYVKNEVLARGSIDSAGKEFGIPVFKDGEDVFTAHEMRYNFETKKGIIHDVVTKEGEGYIHGQDVKINEKREAYISGAKYTTCNLEHPHYAIAARKIKLVPEKVVVTGPFNLEIADVKTPLGFVFGIFPIPQKKSSGIIIPTYGESAQRGFFLSNGGFYWAANDYLGMKFYGDIYTNGSWRFNIDADYKKRYAYDGGLQLSLTKIIDGFDGDTNTNSSFLDGKSYWVKWQHNPKQKGNSRFSAKVNMGSANYNRNNSYNVDSYLSASFNSTVTYYKKFGSSPFSLNASARQDQSQDGTQNFTLPDLAFNMQRRFPFKFIKGKSSAWYKKLSVQYNMSTRNKISNVKNPYSPTYNIVNDVSEKTFSELDFLNPISLNANSSYGMKHTIPIQTVIKAFRFFNITPRISYEEIWYGSKLNYTDYNTGFPHGGALETGVLLDTINGFNRLYSYNASLAANTRLYGTFYIKKLGIEAMRHTMVPTLSYRYRPDFGQFKYGYYDTVQIDRQIAGVDDPSIYQELSLYEKYIFGVPAAGEQQTLGISIDNIFELKVRDKQDSTKQFKKVKLLDNISLNTSYNFAADSLQLAPLRLSARTRIAGFQIAYNSTHDFYQQKWNSSQTSAVRINKFLWEQGNRWLARKTDYKLALSTNLNPKKRKKKEIEVEDERDRQLLNDINANPMDYVDFSIPWSMAFSYNMQWVKSGFDEPTITQSLTMSGDLSLTEKWKITWNSGYDLVQKDFTPTTFSIIRNLHCWEMRFKWAPFGQWQYYSFDINVRASVLQDLKMSKREDSRYF